MWFPSLYSRVKEVRAFCLNVVKFILILFVFWDLACQAGKRQGQGTGTGRALVLKSLAITLENHFAFFPAAAFGSYRGWRFVTLRYAALLSLVWGVAQRSCVFDAVVIGPKSYRWGKPFHSPHISPQRIAGKFFS